MLASVRWSLAVWVVVVVVVVCVCVCVREVYVCACALSEFSGDMRPARFQKGGNILRIQ